MGWIWHLCLMNMKRRKIRTFLTVLGVMIGVISVVALLAVGIGVKNEMIDSAVASGSVNQITIYSETGSKHKDRMITDRTISTLTDLANVDGCYPLYEVPVSMKYGEYEYFGNLVGVPGNELDGWSLAYGENSNSSHGTPELISGGSVGKMFFNQKTFDSYEKREKKSIASLVGKRFDTTVGWSGESDRIFKLKLAGVLSDGDTDNSFDNASADTSYDSAVQDEESDESLDISDSYSEKSQTIYCDLAASSKERLDDVLFNTEIDDRNLESVTRIEHFLLTCYIENNMSHLPCLNTLHALIKIIILISSDHTSHGTIFSEDLGKCSGIDSFYTSYIILNKKFVYGHLASEIARSLAELSNNES